MSIWLFFNMHFTKKTGEKLFDTRLLNPAWETGVALNSQYGRWLQAGFL